MYNVLVPSKGRATTCKTPYLLEQAGIPFLLMLEPQDHDAYDEAGVPGDRIILDENNKGNGYVHGCMFDRLVDSGDPWAWFLDDDIQSVALLKPKESYFDSHLQKMDIKESMTIMELIAPDPKEVCLAGPRYIQQGRAYDDRRYFWNKNVANFYLISRYSKFMFRDEYKIRAEIRFLLDNVIMGGMKTCSFVHHLFRTAELGNTPGGCKEFYDAGLVEGYAREIAATYPDFVDYSGGTKMRIKWRNL